MRQRTATICIALFLLAVGVGCTSSSPTPPGVRITPAEDAKQKDDRDNPIVKEARADTEEALNDLLAGKYDNDPNYSPVARKVKGFQSWSIESQRIDPDNPRAVNFGGTLQGPGGEASFAASMVKQQNGKWMIGYFQGPYAKQKGR